ncbi:MAG: hypothetical protein OXF08_10725 [Bacteroidetes bacterium]|nr:hypothetical protein [Bacteroidota bacterium]
MNTLTTVTLAVINSMFHHLAQNAQLIRSIREPIIVTIGRMF